MTKATTAAANGAALRPLRLPHIVALLRAQPLPAEVLLPRLNRHLVEDGLPEIQIRTLQTDLEWLLEHLGPSGIERVPRSELQPPPPAEHHRFRLFYRLNGAEDLIPVTGNPVFLSELEALALVAARAVLATPATPGVTAPAGAGPLAEALGGLVRRLGFAAADPRIPDILAVTQAAPQPYDPAHVLAILRAIRLGDGVTMDYQSLGKGLHAVTAQPIRLVLVEGEPYLWAWDGAASKLKNYKVARIVAVVRRDGLPDVPSGLDTQVRGQIAAGFRGVAGPNQRGRVVVRLEAAAVPHLRHRHLGGSQQWVDLPVGGARVSFNTSGMDAIRHWLLQHGGDLTVEAPAALVTWFRDETQRMAARYQG